MTEQTYISLGGGVKLLCEDFYIEASGFQWSRRGFRALCRNLSVPLIEIGTKRYVDVNVFETAMCAVTRIGEPDFFTPGCTAIRKNQQGETRLNPDKLKQSWRIVLRDMIQRRRMNGAEVGARMRRAAREGADRLYRMGVHLAPVAAQAQIDRTPTSFEQEVEEVLNG